MKERRSEALRVRLHPMVSAAEIEGTWRDLASANHHPIFLDWLWIDTWLSSYPGERILIRVEADNQLVALGIVALREERRHGILRSRVAYLHQTGCPAEDQIWIEYNGLLAAPGWEAAALSAAVEGLLEDGRCDEVHLSMLPASLAQDTSESLTTSRPLLEVCGHERDLARLRDSDSDVISSLSANSRAQLRRSLRRYEAVHGAAKLRAAADLEDARAMLREAGHWHQLRWSDSGFGNPSFTGFHETLIKRGFDHGRTQLFSLCFGDYVAGVFYFLLQDRCVHFYLQGVRRETDGKLKPGLTGHWLLMQHFLDQGMDVYDFMGGDSQYKRQLADRETGFVTLRVHNGRWRYRIEDRARQLRRILGR